MYKKIIAQEFENWLVCSGSCDPACWRAGVLASNVVSIRRSASASPRSTPYTANAKGTATPLLASPAMRRTKALRIAS
jgi:hypothetical protein